MIFATHVTAQGEKEAALIGLSGDSRVNWDTVPVAQELVVAVSLGLPVVLFDRINFLLAVPLHQACHLIDDSSITYQYIETLYSLVYLLFPNISFFREKR